MTETNTKEIAADLARTRARALRDRLARAGATMGHLDAVDAAVMNHAAGVWAASTVQIGGFDYRRCMADAELNALTVRIVCLRYGIDIWAEPELVAIAAMSESEGGAA
jgi:hypothetical protein